MGCVPSKKTVGSSEDHNDKTKHKATDINFETKINPTIVKDVSEYSVNKDGTSLKDDNSIFDFNTSSRTLDTLGLIKINDDLASTVSLKSFPLDGNIVIGKNKPKDLSPLNAVEENNERAVSAEEPKSQTSRPTSSLSSNANNCNNSTTIDAVDVSNSNDTAVLEHGEEIGKPEQNDELIKPTITITSEDGCGDAVVKPNSTMPMKEELERSLHIAPFPSAVHPGPSKIDIEFEAILHMSCFGSNKAILFEKCRNQKSLTVERSLSLFDDNCAVLYNILQNMINLTTLNLAGLYMGPIAFRTTLLALKFSKHLMEINLSDNLGDTECCDLIAELLLENLVIKSLNLSGNTLGKESLSRSLGRALLQNNTLESLDISSCGMSSVHSICEAIRSNELIALTQLNIAHNNLSDPQQFAIDVSLVLEKETCSIKKLNITGVGLEWAQMEVILKCLQTNKSLQEFKAGQNTVKTSMTIADFIVLSGCHPTLQVLDLSNTRRDEEFTSDMSKSWTETIHESCKLQSLLLADCGLNDDLVLMLAPILTEKMKNLTHVDLSGNNDISENALENFFKFIGSENSPLGFKFLFEMSNADCCMNALQANPLPQLKHLSIKKSRLSENAVLACENFTCSIDEINLDSIKLGRSDILSNLLSYKCFASLSKLSLSNSVLNDPDLHPVISNIRRSNPTWPLVSLDVSVNRLTDAFTSDLSEALLTHKTHTLHELNLSNNQFKDRSLEALLKLFTSTSHKTSLDKLNFSNNCLSSKAVTEFMSFMYVKNDLFPLSYLDFRAQDEGFTEDSMDEVAEELISKLTLSRDDDKMSFEFRDIKQKFNIHLTNLGGTAGTKLQAIDSAAIKTDLVKMKKMTGCLADALQIFGSFSKATVTETSFSTTLSIGEWQAIIGQDSPKWLLVNSNLAKCVLITHMPATVTHQRLEGLLEMEVDCSVKDIYFLKDPILRKPTGTAWVLFENETSVSDSVKWFVNGQAQMYGTPFIICRVSVVLSEDAGAETLARKELEQRERDLRKERAADQTMLDQSERLAAERAAYREAHPAYQNGRIS